MRGNRLPALFEQEFLGLPEGFGVAPNGLDSVHGARLQAEQSVTHLHDMLGDDRGRSLDQSVEDGEDAPGRRVLDRQHQTIDLLVH